MGWPWQVTANNWHIFYNKLLHSGQAMAECVILEAAEAEEGKIFEEDANDVLITGGSSFEECLIEVQVVPPD